MVGGTKFTWGRIRSAAHALIDLRNLTNLWNGAWVVVLFSGYLYIRAHPDLDQQIRNFFHYSPYGRPVVFVLVIAAATNLIRRKRSPQDRDKRTK